MDSLGFFVEILSDFFFIVGRNGLMMKFTNIKECTRVVWMRVHMEFVFNNKWDVYVCVVNVKFAHLYKTCDHETIV